MLKKIKADCIYANGDSWTAGYGLKQVSDSFVELVGQHFALPVRNHALSGGSNDRILRSTVADVAKMLEQNIKPFVFVAWTQPHRFELWDEHNQDWRSCVSPTATEYDLAHTLWAKHSNDTSDLIKFVTQVICLDAYLKTNNVPFFFCVTSPLKLNILLSNEFKTYYQYLVNTVQVDVDHLFKLSLDEYLGLYPNIPRQDTSRHPSTQGHQLLASFLIDQITTRFQIN